MTKEYQNYVNGEWKSSVNQIEILSPIDDSSLGFVPAMTREEVDHAMKAGREALPAWAALTVYERAQYLHKAADIIERDKEEIATVLAKEISKAYNASVTEVVRTADLIRYAAEEGIRLSTSADEGGKMDASTGHKLAVIRRQPVGIVLAIAPYNYPVNLSGSKIAPALIGGNVVMFKPPTQGSVSGLVLAKAFAEAGLPAGVFNTITGRGSEIGDYIVEHEEVNFINFTGSTPVGKRIGKLAGMRPIMLELGGKDAGVVLADADLDNAAKQIVAGAYDYSGQRCTAIKRVLVVEEVADELAEKISENVAKLSVGDPFDNATVTPVIDDNSADFIESLVVDARQKGAKELNEFKRDGRLLTPGLFDHVTLDMKLAWEEPFGPILPIIRVKDAEEAVAIANKSNFGLQSSVFTRDFQKAFDIANKLEVGTVHINNKTGRGPDNFPFLGLKGSGAGVQGIRYSIEAMTNVKSIVFDMK